jgi:hydrogenase expression/formation protein HypC
MCLAIPGRVVELAGEAGELAVVDVSGVRRTVNLELLLDDMPGLGDWVLIHVGFAMSRISEQAAEEQMRTLALLGEDQAALDEVRGYGTAGEERP